MTEDHDGATYRRLFYLMFPLLLSSAFWLWNLGTMVDYWNSPPVGAAVMYAVIMIVVSADWANKTLEVRYAQ